MRHQIHHASNSIVEEQLDPFSLVADELSMVANRLRSMVVAEVPKLASAAEYFFKMGVEGKRFRPMVLLLMASALNGNTPESTLTSAGDSLTTELRTRQQNIAEIVEMIHVASLLHDDVLDDADARRGIGSLNFVMGNKESFYSDRKGSFGTRLAQTSINSHSPAQWWFYYGEDAPNLRKITLKVLSQTCSSSGCERNWSTFSLIHAQIRNRLAMDKLEMLVFVHYNLRLRVKGLTVKSSSDPEYCPIDLNHIFDDQDILDPWIVETETPLLDGEDNQWLDEGMQTFATTEGKRQQAENVRPDCSGSGTKQKTHVYVVEEASSSSDSSSKDGGDKDENDGRTAENQSENLTVNDEYYATQDTDHGYRPGIDARRGHLNRLTEFSSQTQSDEPPL